MDFVAIDVETANPDMASICQIGIARFSDGELIDEWVSLIDPEDHFDDVNVSIHGICKEMVKGQPKLPELADKLHDLMDGTVTVCHTHFDRLAVAKAFNRYKLPAIANTWLDSARVVRRTWKDLSWRGYGLASVCRKIGYEFKHHDALEDAKAAGHVLLAAMQESETDLEGWLDRVNYPIGVPHQIGDRTIHREGAPDGDLFGEVIVFTGTLEMPRSEASALAASVGCRVDEGVTKHTTILVVGDQDEWKLAGYKKSSKHRKAEQLAAGGQPIRIVLEADFKALVESAKPVCGNP